MFAVVVLPFLLKGKPLKNGEVTPDKNGGFLKYHMSQPERTTFLACRFLMFGALIMAILLFCFSCPTATVLDFPGQN